MVANAASLYEVLHVQLDLALVVDDEQVGREHGKDDDLSVVLAVSSLRAAEALGVEHEQPLDAALRALRRLRELLQSKVDAFGAPSSRREELRAEGVIHQRALAT